MSENASGSNQETAANFGAEVLAYNKEQAGRELRREIEQLYIDLKPLLERFEQAGIPIVATRTTAIYLAAYEQNKLDAMSSNWRGGNILDFDGLVPAELQEDIDRLLMELHNDGLIELEPIEKTEGKAHASGFKSRFFRVFTMGKRRIELFGSFGVNLSDTVKAKGGDSRLELMEIEVDESGKPVASREGDSVKELNIHDRVVYYFAGKGLRESYKWEETHNPSMPEQIKARLKWVFLGKLQQE